MDLKQRVLYGLGWSAVSRFGAQLITWGITIVIIRLVAPADYGLMELAMVFVGFLGMLSELGLGAAVVQRKTLDELTLRSLFGMVLCACASFFLLLASSAPLIADFYHEDRLVPVIRVLSLQFFLLGFSVLPQSLLLRDMAFRKIAIVDFVAMVAGSLTSLVLALEGQGVWALVWGSVAIRVVALVGVNLAQPFLHLPRFILRGMRTIVAFGGYVTLARIFWFFFMSADILIIGKVLGKELVGFYAVGMQLASLPMEKVSGIINQVAFPAWSSVQSEPGMAGQYLLKTVRIMSLLSFPILWGISSTAPEIIDIFLGPKWRYSSLPLQIIAVITPVRMVYSLMGPAVLGAGRADVSMYNALTAAVLMSGAFVVGSFWGLTGVSLAWVIAYPPVFWLTCFRVAKVLGIRIGDILKAMQPPFLCGLTVYAGVVAVKHAQMLAIEAVPRIILLVASGAAIYCLMTLLFNRRGLDEVWKLVKAVNGN